jgi:putative ABC transport system ATP-binding protein
MPASLHTDSKLYHIASTLNLGSSQPELLRELILEADKSSDNSLFQQLEQLALGLGEYLVQVRLTPSKLWNLTQQNRFILELDEAHYLLLERDKNKLRLHEWQDDDYRVKNISKRQLINLLGPEARVCLSRTHKSKASKTPKVSPRKRLFNFLHMESRELWLILAYSLAIGFLGLGVPIASQSLVNNIAFGALRQPLVVLCFLVLITLGFLAFMRSLQLMMVEMLQRRIFVKVSSETAQKLVHAQMAETEPRRLSELVNRFFDVVTVQKSAAFLLLDGLSLLLGALTGLLLLAFYHPLLLIFDIILLLSIAFILFVMGINGEPTSIKESAQKYEIAAWLEEIATHLLLFKTENGTRYANWKTHELLNHYLDARHVHFRVVLRQSVGTYILQAVANTALLGLGGWLVIEGQLTIGQLVAAELVVANVVNNFSKMGKHLETYYDLMAAFDKLGYLFDLPQEALSVSQLPNKEQGIQIEIENLNYKHPRNYKQIEQLNLVCQPGEKLALLGANTWECNTLLDILYGLYPPHHGLVLVDKQPLHQLQSNHYRSQVVLLRQLELIEVSLLENLRLGDPELSRKDAQKLLEQVGLWERVQHLPQVLDTPISFNGFPLSTAEAHRLMLARALSMRPRLLILDGTIDRMDWHLDGPVAQMLFEHTSEMNSTLIVATNQTEILQRFDRILSFGAQGQLQDHCVSLENGGRSNAEA